MGAKRAILGFLALLPVLSAARFSAPSQATTLLSLHRDARRATGEGYLRRRSGGHLDSFRTLHKALLLMIHALYSLHSFH